MLDGKCCAYFVHSNFKVCGGTLAAKQRWKLSSSHSTLLVLATPGVITKEELKTFLSDNDEWSEAQVDEHVKQVDFWACFLYISSFIQVYTYCSGMNADWRWDGSSWRQYYFCTVGGVVWEKSLIIFQQRFRVWTGFLLRRCCAAVHFDWKNLVQGVKSMKWLACCSNVFVRWKNVACLRDNWNCRSTISVTSIINTWDPAEAHIWISVLIFS